MAINKEEVTGIILAGGRSSRMGKDKGLCSFRDKPLVSYAVDTLKPLCGEMMISVNHFPEKYAAFGLPVVPDEIQNIGPMGGLHACLKRSKTQHNLVISCDTPFVSTDVFRLLLQHVENYQVVCPSHDTFLIEPLSAYYNTNILGDLEKAIQHKEFKMMRFLKRIRFRTVPVEKGQSVFRETLFLNLNTPEDLKRAEELEL
ncbi:MAG TPA: molybdenum cofactor guanylyltransferase [Bacteroidetes bacterium]|nr:molybdenum cofactor guanylyltransferase [Bacteroidota bacterium]